MTKTSAAKRFASEHGVYDRLLGEYAPGSSLDKMGTTLTNQLLTSTREDLTDTRRRLRKSTDLHNADLRVVMALLGVEDQYEDTVERQYVPSPSLTGFGTYEYGVTESATEKFAKDLRAAQSAVEGAAALKRIRKAIKAVKKEESK